jgi:hypothetical protein
MEENPMAKATRVHSTQRRTVAKFPDEEFRDQLADAFRSMESEFCDLDRISEIADRLTAEWIEISGKAPREAELAVCAVQQLHRALKEFKAKYYRAYTGDKALQSATS